MISFQKSQENIASCHGLPKPVELNTLPKQLDAELKAIENLIKTYMAGKSGTQNKVSWCGARCLDVMQSGSYQPRPIENSDLNIYNAVRNGYVNPFILTLT